MHVFKFVARCLQTQFVLNRITMRSRLPDRWRHWASGWRKGSEVMGFLFINNAIVARGILDINIALWDTRTASAPSTLLVLLEPH